MEDEKPQEPTIEPPIEPHVSVGGQGAIMHNHGSNFGRYVVGCPACIKKYPNGPPTRRPRAKPGHQFDAVRDETNSTMERMPTMQSQMATKAVAHPITGSDLIDAIKALQGDQRDALIAFAQELRKPDPEEQAEKEKTKARKIEDKIQMRRAVEEQKAIAERAQALCGSFGHKKENGRTAVSGQVHSDGLLHLLCVRCNKQFPGVLPDKDHMPTGVTVI